MRVEARNVCCCCFFKPWPSVRTTVPETFKHQIDKFLVLFAVFLHLRDLFAAASDVFAVGANAASRVF